MSSPRTESYFKYVIPMIDSLDNVKTRVNSKGIVVTKRGEHMDYLKKQAFDDADKNFAINFAWYEALMFRERLTPELKQHYDELLRKNGPGVSKIAK
jgi:hypothetical protein